MNSFASKHFKTTMPEYPVTGSCKVFNIQSGTVIFIGELTHALGVKYGYNQFYCLPCKPFKYYIMDFVTVFKSIQETNGASYNIHTGAMNPSKGYMVALSSLYEEICNIPKDANEFHTIVIQYVLSKEVWAKIKDNPSNIFLGFWISNNRLIIDLSENIDHLGQAMARGYDRFQLAIYDCKNKCDIKLPLVSILEDDVEIENLEKDLWNLSKGAPDFVLCSK